MKRPILLSSAFFLLASALAVAETIHLEDGTMLKGRVLSISEDSLFVKASFGARVAIPRASVLSIDFTDGKLAPSPGKAGATMKPRGEGRIAVSFTDRTLSSKIGIRKKDDERALLQANWIVETLFVDGEPVYTFVDSVMDKEIYKGPRRIHKNTIELEDIDVALPVGTYNCLVVVESRGRDEHADRFDDDPLHLTIALDNVRIDPGRATRYRVGIDRGRFSLGKPRFELEGH